MSKILTVVCKNDPSHIFQSYADRSGKIPQFCSTACYKLYGYRPKQIKKRFWSQVDIRFNEECWVWKGTINRSSGYGQFGYMKKSGKQKLVLAHRFAYRISVGKILEGLFVLHTCDVRLCCNPLHLFLGTQDDNIQDMVRKDRQAKGENNGNVKLTESAVRDILRLREDGYTLQSIADVYEVSISLISVICRGKIWKHVER